jgi:hypothetical protein
MPMPIVLCPAGLVVIVHTVAEVLVGWIGVI